MTGSSSSSIFPHPLSGTTRFRDLGFLISRNLVYESIVYLIALYVAQSLLQDEGGEMMGGGSDGATGIGHSGQRLQTSQCGTERQVHICSVSALMVIFAHYHLARIIVMNLVIAPWFEMLGCTRAKLWRLGDRGRKEESQKITSG